MQKGIGPDGCTVEEGLRLYREAFNSEVRRIQRERGIAPGSCAGDVTGDLCLDVLMDTSPVDPVDPWDDL